MPTSPASPSWATSRCSSICRPDLPAANPKELVELLRAKPGGYTYGSPGIGYGLHRLLTEG